MTTYPLNAALDLADWHGWKPQTFYDPKFALDHLYVAYLVHPRTGRDAILACENLGNDGAYSNHWWIYGSGRTIELLGGPAGCY